MTWYVQYTVTATAFICMFNVQVHIDKESEDWPSSTDPVKLAWRRGAPGPPKITMYSGTAVVNGSIAYFSVERSVYSYTVSEDKWTKLPEYEFLVFALAVVKGNLTTIGGFSGVGVTNSLFSLSGSSWKKVLPPMPTKRCRPAAASTPTHLVVAGGMSGYISGHLFTVEVLSQESLQWSTASSLPVDVPYPQLTLCGGSFYLLHSSRLYFCSVEDLLKSCEPATNSSDGGSVIWTELAAVPVENRSSLVTLRGRVLAIGGAEDLVYGNETGAIHCYNVTTNSWSVIGEMPTPRSFVLAAVLPSNGLVVVGGMLSGRGDCSIVDIGRCL